MNRKRHTGFSLVELVIVIVILAIISAIALPRVGRGAKGADESALGQNLAIMRSAIEMYAAEHAGSFPGDQIVDQLTKYTDRSGATSDTKTQTYVYGPYLLRIPPLTVGPNAGKNDVTVVTTGPEVGGTSGWVYNKNTGKIIANCGLTDESGSRTYDNW